MRIATWNINSVRLRLEQVLRLIKDQNINIICLQETKTQDEYFPYDSFKKIGMNYQYYRGKKSYNGVAILSNFKLEDENFINWCGKDDTRHISVKLNKNIELHNFYIPAGGDIPDTKLSDKFNHKINFIEELKGKIFSHQQKKQLLNVVSHTPIETETLLGIIQSGEWADVMREIVPSSEKLYSWWSYRNRNWEVSNRGRRLDHFWVSKKLFSQVKSGVIYKDTRAWERPSDHVPIIVDIDI